MARLPYTISDLENYVYRLKYHTTEQTVDKNSVVEFLDTVTRDLKYGIDCSSPRQNLPFNNLIREPQS